MTTSDPIREARYTGPLLTTEVCDAFAVAIKKGMPEVTVSLDLGRSQHRVRTAPDHWEYDGERYPYPERCKKRTIYAFADGAFEPISRFSHSLIKLVPTPWGAPTFEIDGIKMLPTQHLSPWTDAGNKVDLIEPQGKTILDTCGGLGYFAAWCLDRGAARVDSFEKNADVLWLRTLNPWSPDTAAAEASTLRLRHGDVSMQIEALPDGAYDAVLHDPPRFGIAGELYSQHFYDQIARVLTRGGVLFHYTGTPNKKTSGRDVPSEVAARLQRAGFTTRFEGDGVFAVKRGRR